ncbi:MAG: hypothetical protein FD123_2640 [Bacteroidetes bacterium]|nr:MAG: hypothetical protein FD123_2640 [Bacteroidota bacterium]
MKRKPVNFFTHSVFMTALLAAGCSSETEKKTADKPAEEKAAKAEGKGCCFTKNEDFVPFFPGGNALLTVHGSPEVTVSIRCGADDDPKRSTGNQKYQIDKAGTSDPMKAKYISLKISDYCSDPADLASEIKRRTANAEKAAAGNAKVTFARIEKKDVYSGYTWMDASSGNNASNVELMVEVGGRFRVHIQGIDHNRMDALNQLFEMIPVDKLAGF